MSYFGGASRTAGDPGLFDTIRGAAIGAFRNLPIVGPGIRAAEFFTRPRAGRGKITAVPPRQQPAAGIRVSPDMMGVRRKPRRMNMGNTKALKRSIRRTDGFVKLAKEALKNTGWTLVSKSSLATTRAKSKARHPHHHR